MRYIMKAGILYNDDALAVLARVKSSLVGPLKKSMTTKGSCFWKQTSAVLTR